MAPLRSDEVQKLLATTRSLVNQAHSLSRSIDDTVEELHEFAADLKGASAAERRVIEQSYEGGDRRDRA